MSEHDHISFTFLTPCYSFEIFNCLKHFELQEVLHWLDLSGTKSLAWDSTLHWLLLTLQWNLTGKTGEGSPLRFVPLHKAALLICAKEKNKQTCFKTIKSVRNLVGWFESDQIITFFFCLYNLTLFLFIFPVSFKADENKFS